MATPQTTLQTIITRIRQRTNTEQSQFVTDAELTGWINDSLSQLDMLLTSKFDDYKLLNLTGSPDSSGRLQILNPAQSNSFYRLRGVDVIINANDPDGFLPMRRFSFRQRARKPYLLGLGTGFGPGLMEYRLQGNYIQLEPVAIANQYTYRIWYTPDYTPLVNPTDTLQPYMDSLAWFDYAVADCAIKVLAKQDLDPATFVMQKNEMRDLIMLYAAPARDDGEPPAMVDTRYWMSNGGGYGWGW